MDSGHTHYTQAVGETGLRERISRWYAERFGLDVPAHRIIVTAGASAALQLACLALVERGDEVLMPDPCYPCNRHFVAAADGVPVLLPARPTSASSSARRASRPRGRRAPRACCWRRRRTRPAPRSTPREMGRIVQAVRARGGFTIVDEIYLALSFDDAYGHSALAHAQPDDVISINSFSKYFCMTGWRLGWMVVPEVLVAPIEKLAQNLFICPSTLAQHAALACFEPESIAEYERRRAAFRARRDYLVPALDALGLTVPVMPDGAFYAWADVSAHAASSWDFAFDIMRRAHVAITPGRDFGRATAERFVRFSYANSMAQLHEAVARLAAAL